MSKQGHIQLPSTWGQKNCFIKVKYDMQTVHQKAHLLYQSEKLHLKLQHFHPQVWLTTLQPEQFYITSLFHSVPLYIYILTNNSWPKSEPADTVITGILLPLARMVGLRQK